MYKDIKINKLPKSQVEIIGSIPTDKFESFRSKAIENINKEVKLDGFRQGNIPEKVLKEKVGEMMILEEMSELALSKAYPSIVIDNKIDAIGRPEIQITKLAAGNPLEFRIVTSVVPEITLPDYKKIAKEIMTEVKDEKIEITDKDVEVAINRIRKSKAEHSHDHDESHDKMTKEEHDKLIESSMPEITDEFVRQLGNFKDVADFHEKIRTALAEDKKEQFKEKRRISLSDKISDATTVDIPEVLVASETRRIEAQFKDDVSRMGVTFEDYLKHAKKTVEEIRKEWSPFAEKKAKLQIIINNIAKAENISVDEKEIEDEVKHIVEHYSDADKERAHIYAESVLTNEKVFQFLEAQK